MSYLGIGIRIVIYPLIFVALLGLINNRNYALCLWDNCVYLGKRYVIERKGEKLLLRAVLENKEYEVELLKDRFGFIVLETKECRFYYNIWFNLLLKKKR